MSSHRSESAMGIPVLLLGCQTRRCAWRPPEVRRCGSSLPTPRSQVSSPDEHRKLIQFYAFSPAPQCVLYRHREFRQVSIRKVTQRTERCSRLKLVSIDGLSSSE